jgi:hypothetical protein
MATMQKELDALRAAQLAALETLRAEMAAARATHDTTLARLQVLDSLLILDGRRLGDVVRSSKW